MHLGAGTRQAAPRPARQSVLVAVLRIVTWGVDSAPHRPLFPSPSIHIQRRKRTAPKHHPQDSRRQREPEGRSPAQSAGKAEQRECRAREDYGWGWAGGVTKPNPLSIPATTPPRTGGVTKPNPLSVPATTPPRTGGVTKPNPLPIPATTPPRTGGVTKPNPSYP